MGLLSLLKSISIGSFTNKNEYENHPFWQLRNTKWLLFLHKELLVQKMITSGCAIIFIDNFKKSFDYFVENPKEYDGASGDNELHKIDKYYYDITAINHDMFDKGNFTNTYKRLLISDKFMIRNMEQLGDSSFHIDKRAAFLFIIAPVRYLISYKRRKDNPKYSESEIKEIETFMKEYKINYKRIIKYSILIIIIIIALLYNNTFVSIIKLIG